MAPTTMVDGGASAYLSFSCNDNAAGTWNHGLTPYFGGNLQCLQFLLGRFGGNGSPWSFLLAVPSVDSRKGS